MKPPRPILFVCTGNICRSPMAEALFSHLARQRGLGKIKAFSRGILRIYRQPMAPLAGWALTEWDVSFGEHRSRPITKADVARAGVILVMEAAHRAQIVEKYPAAGKKTFLLKEYVGASGSPEIKDPIGLKLSDFRRCRDELQSCLIRLVSKLQAKEEGSHV